MNYFTSSSKYHGHAPVDVEIIILNIYKITISRKLKIYILPKMGLSCINAG